MSDLLRSGGVWLEQQRAAYLASSVTYARGRLSVPVGATIGRTEFEVDNGYGILERIESRDFLILAADLQLNAAAVLPQQGDTITEGAFVYEVNAPGKEPCWRYSDLYRQTLRIHTKLLTHT